MSQWRASQITALRISRGLQSTDPTSHGVSTRASFAAAARSSMICAFGCSWRKLAATTGVIDPSILIFFRLHTLTIPPFALYTHNTSITEWELEQSGGFHEREQTANVARWRLVRYNDDYHIRDLPDEGEPSSPAARAMDDTDDTDDIDDDES